MRGTAPASPSLAPAKVFGAKFICEQASLSFSRMSWSLSRTPLIALRHRKGNLFYSTKPPSAVHALLQGSYTRPGQSINIVARDPGPGTTHIVHTV